MVVPDRCGKREEALQDTDRDARDRPAAVGFEIELGFEGVSLIYSMICRSGFEEPRAWLRPLVFTGRPDQYDPGLRSSFSNWVLMYPLSARIVCSSRTGAGV